jgi:UPF0755 protein
MSEDDYTTPNARGPRPPRPTPRSPREAIHPEPAPPPPTRSRAARNPFVIVMNFLLTMAVFAVLGLGVLVYWGSVEYTEPGPLAQDRAVIISPGSGLNAIADTLASHNVISDPWIFLGVAKLYGTENQFKAGEYLFRARMSMSEVMETIIAGRSVQHSITVPEGLTSAQIVDRLNQDPILVGSIAAIPPEGALLPETYKFTRGTTRQQMLERMQRSQEQALEDIWARRNPGIPIASPEELVVLASIVEKETGRADERTRVAGVFINRLNKRMRLQSDPTILYGIYGGTAWLRPRTILRSDMQRPNPYNTYQIDGLPPGPIANPGRESLEAVANPSRTEDIYFVADGTGGHVFAVTLDEHNRNVARWREIEQQRRAAQPGDAPAANTPAN